VAAVSARGSGPFSDTIVVQTDEDGRLARDRAEPAHAHRSLTTKTTSCRARSTRVKLETIARLTFRRINY